jgi:hypothetical protein
VGANRNGAQSCLQIKPLPLHLSGAIGTFLRMMKRASLLIIAVFVLSCDHGLAPPPSVEAGFGGTLYFEKGTWPPTDSLFNLWVFASQVYPLDSAKVMQGLFSSPPTIYLYPASDKNLPFNIDSVSYAFKLPVSTYKYVGVIQRFASDITVRTLRVVGMYGTNDTPPIPIPVIVSEGSFTTGISFRVNFRQPPPPPF